VPPSCIRDTKSLRSIKNVEYEFDYDVGHGITMNSSDISY